MDMLKGDYMEKEVLDKLDVEGRRIYKKTGVPMGATDLPDVAENLRKKDKGNPGKPPREWFNVMFNLNRKLDKNKGVSDAELTKMVLRYWHKVYNDDDRKAAIMAYEHRLPSIDEFHSEETNPSNDTPSITKLDEHLKEIHDFLDELISKMEGIDYTNEYMIDTIIPQYIQLIQNELNNINILRGLKRKDIDLGKVNKSIEETKGLLRQYKRN